jgi:hypothetical protein
MHWPASLFRWEWAIGEVIILPLLLWELWRLRRSQRQDREAAAKRANSEPPPEGGPV